MQRNPVIFEQLLMKNTTIKTFVRMLPACFILANQGLAAPSSLQPSKPKTEYLWNQIYGSKTPQKKLHLYKNDENPYVQEVNVTLRMQYQAAWVNGQVGNYPGSHNWTSEFRRFRAGWNAKVLHDFKIQNVWNVGGVDNNGYWDKKTARWEDHGQTKTSLYEAFIQYNHKNSGNCFSFGKTNPEIYAENRVSSGSLKTPDMSIAEQTLLFDSVWGAWAANDTKKNDLGYYLGIWSGTNDSNKQIWGTWQSFFTTAELSYNIDKVLLDKGRVYVDWVHSFANRNKPLAGNSENFVGSQCQNVISAYYIGSHGKFDLTTEMLWGLKSNNRAAGNLFGFTFMPSYNINEHLEAVVKFQLASGNNAVNVGKNRYAKSLQKESPGNADRYYSVGAGMNFYVYAKDHSRLKIMTMMEYGNSSVSEANRAKNAGFTGWQFVCGAYTNF